MNESRKIPARKLPPWGVRTLWASFISTVFPLIYGVVFLTQGLSGGKFSDIALEVGGFLLIASFLAIITATLYLIVRNFVLFVIMSVFTAITMSVSLVGLWTFGSHFFASVF